MNKLKVYVLNLERHHERFASVSSALEGQGFDWERFPGIDGQAVTDEYLDSVIDRSGPIPRMTRGARACTAGQIQILREFLSSDADYALILEDDVEISRDFGARVRVLLNSERFDLLNLNRQPTRKSKKRIIVRRRQSLKINDMVIHDIEGVNYGAAGYIVGRPAAQVIVDLYGHPNMPIDHILFNPNVSKLFGRIKIQQLFPALTQPRKGLVSSIQNEPVAEASSIRSRLMRAWTELAIAPRLLVGTLFGFYSAKELLFVEREVPESKRAG